MPSIPLIRGGGTILALLAIVFKHIVTPSQIKAINYTVIDDFYSYSINANVNIIKLFGDSLKKDLDLCLIITL